MQLVRNGHLDEGVGGAGGDVEAVEEGVVSGVEVELVELRKHVVSQRTLQVEDWGKATQATRIRLSNSV